MNKYSFDTVDIYTLPFIKPFNLKRYMTEEEYEKITNVNEMMKWVLKQEKIDKKKKNILVAHQFFMNNGTIPELSQNMIYNISFITNIPVNYIENLEQSFKMDKTIKEYLSQNNLTIKKYINKFNYKELAQKYGIVYTDIKDDYYIAKDILKYLRITNPNTITKEKNTIFYKSKNNKPELLALWLERCNRIIENQKIKKYTKESIDNLVRFIKDEAKLNHFNESKLIEEFNKNGIYLAIEDDLTGTKVRGAFKVLNDKPAIYITRKHKRYADIYFALLHELAHCKSDFNRAKSGSIISTAED